jgi:hypothetical protein
MDNSSHILKNLNNDVNQVLASSSSQNQIIYENDTDLIRRRRLERLANRTSPTTEIQDDNTNNNA